jgi:hypothetical protein
MSNSPTTTTVRVKSPPNILVLTENDNDFQNTRSYLLSLIGINTYTIYKISYADLAASTTWMQNCSLLVTVEQYGDKVLSESHLERKVLSLRSFLNRGGKILSVPSLNENCEKLCLDGMRVLSFFKSYFYFEFVYESKFGMTKTVCRLNGDELNSKELFYSYTSDQFNSGLHFISRVNYSSLIII